MDRNYDGGSFVTFKDGNERLFREEPDEVSRRIDEVNGLPGTMPTHNHGADGPAASFGMEGMI